MNSEEFNIRTQHLLRCLKETEQFDRYSQESINQLKFYLNEFLVDSHKKICDDIENNEKIFERIEESCDSVNKLLYIRKNKLKEITLEINQVMNTYVGFNSTQPAIAEIIQNNQEILKVSQSKVKNFQNYLAALKNEVRIIGNDSVSQYFLQIRRRQSIDILNEIKI